MAFPVIKGVPLKVNVKLVTRDSARNFKCELATTESISADGFLCICSTTLLQDAVMDVYLVGQEDRYVGNARLVRTEAAGTAWPRYGFQFLEKNQDWLF